MNRIRWAGVAMLLGASGGAWAIPIGGIEFPDGYVSFADAVVSYSPGADVAAGYNDPTAALGAPDYPGSPGTGTFASLGNSGSLVLQFTDNSLTTSGDATADLHVFEIGEAVEWFNLAISTDGNNWIDLGNILGQPTSVDIDAFAGVVAGTSYSFVRLLDVAPNQSNSPWGEADIDAVGAISSASPVTPPTSVPEPAPLGLLLVGLLFLGLPRLTNQVVSRVTLQKVSTIFGHG